MEIEEINAIDEDEKVSMGPREVSKRDLIRALIASKGIVSEAAKALGVKAEHVFYWIGRDEKYVRARDEGRRKRIQEMEDDNAVIVSKARASLHANLDKHDVTTTIFVMRHGISIYTSTHK